MPRILASYKDRAGYTIEMEAYIDTNPHSVRYQGIDKNFLAHPHMFPLGLNRRVGRMFITNPLGERLQHKYWLGRTEKEWKMSSRAFRSRGVRGQAKLELTQQATAYLPLSEQWLFQKERLVARAQAIEERRLARLQYAERQMSIAA
jgi:hypothetical protein